MNVFCKAIAALAIIGATASIADAAIVTNTYSVTSTFAQGSINSITQQFTLTFDPTSGVSPTVTGYSSSNTGITSVLGEVRRSFIDDPSEGSNEVGIFRGLDGASMGPKDPYYLLAFRFNNSGSLVESSLRYSEGVDQYFSTKSVASIVTLPGTGAGAVPEPATWAMMMLGFGGMGYAMRRRTAAPRIRFA